MVTEFRLTNGEWRSSGVDYTIIQPNNKSILHLTGCELRDSCPKCDSGIQNQKTFNKKFMITCSDGGLQDLVEYAKNIDEVYLEFSARYDQGQTPNKKEMNVELKEARIIRDKSEIEKIIQENTPDQITKDVLYSKKDYISYYKTIKEPDPELGTYSR